MRGAAPWPQLYSKISRQVAVSGMKRFVNRDVLQNLLDNVQKNLARAERDNDLIYHKDIPALSGLPPIDRVAMVKSIIPPGLSDPKSAVNKDGVIFGELPSWGAKMAIGE